MEARVVVSVRYKMQHTDNIINLLPGGFHYKPVGSNEWAECNNNAADYEPLAA